MVEVINTSIRTAKKEHVCNFCNESIMPGQRYIDYLCKNTDDDSHHYLYHFKCHIECQFLVDECGEGYIETDDDFYDMEKELLQELICKDCPMKYEGENFCDSDYMSFRCIQKLATLLSEYRRVWVPSPDHPGYGKYVLEKRETPVDLEV